MRISQYLRHPVILPVIIAIGAAIFGWFMLAIFPNEPEITGAALLQRIAYMAALWLIGTPLMQGLIAMRAELGDRDDRTARIYRWLYGYYSAYLIVIMNLIWLVKPSDQFYELYAIWMIVGIVMGALMSQPRLGGKTRPAASLTRAYFDVDTPIDEMPPFNRWVVLLYPVAAFAFLTLTVFADSPFGTHERFYMVATFLVLLIRPVDYRREGLSFGRWQFRSSPAIAGALIAAFATFYF